MLQGGQSGSAFCWFKLRERAARTDSSTLSARPTLEANRYEGRSNLRKINQSNFGGVSPRAVTFSDIGHAAFGR
jgi:hypothetical protein